MSYILDALKKSDRERQQGKIPGLHSIHDPSPASADSHLTRHWKKYITTTGLLILVLIAAATWYWMKFPNGSKNSPPIDLTGKTTELTIEIPSPPSTQFPGTESPGPESLAEATNSPPSPSPVLTTRSKEIILLPDQTDPPQKDKVEASLPPQGSQDIPDIKELPPLIQSVIPDLNLAGHTYSEDPGKRMIIINSNILREGDRVNDTIKLVEITWTGVLLDYNGTQFAIDID